MKISCDPAKHAKTLRERGLRFEDAAEVFAGVTFDDPDLRRDYGELRIITIGVLRGRVMVVVWTPRGEARHSASKTRVNALIVISMRKANEREKAQYGHRLEENR
jgi:uncharacterized DUF497 family protein